MKSFLYWIQISLWISSFIFQLSSLEYVSGNFVNFFLRREWWLTVDIEISVLPSHKKSKQTDVYLWKNMEHVNSVMQCRMMCMLVELSLKKFVTKCYGCWRKLSARQCIRSAYSFHESVLKFILKSILYPISIK